MISCTKTGMYYARGQWVAADHDAPAKLSALGFDQAAMDNAKPAPWPGVSCNPTTRAAIAKTSS